MSFEKQIGLQAVQSNAELESLVERIVESAIARIEGALSNRSSQAKSAQN